MKNSRARLFFLWFSGVDRTAPGRLSGAGQVEKKPQQFRGQLASGG
jgi:hypothetical protein